MVPLAPPGLYRLYSPLYPGDDPFIGYGKYLCHGLDQRNRGQGLLCRHPHRDDHPFACNLLYHGRRRPNPPCPDPTDLSGCRGYDAPLWAHEKCLLHPFDIGFFFKGSRRPGFPTKVNGNLHEGVRFPGLVLRCFLST